MTSRVEEQGLETDMEVDETLGCLSESPRLRLLPWRTKRPQVEECWKFFFWQCLPVLVMWRWQTSERRKAQARCVWKGPKGDRQLGQRLSEAKELIQCTF